MGEVFTFSCGCKLPIVDGKLELDRNNLNEHCPKTWELYKKGQTQSIFQLESFFAKNWTKEFQPNSTMDVASLISIVRPGTLKAVDENGESMTRVFCKRKNGLANYEKEGAFNELLKETFQIIIFQEDLMKICKVLAGFTPKQNTTLLKSIGKKLPEVLFALEQQFIDGCDKVGKVSREEAAKIFDNIKASARYLFNKCVCPNSTFVETKSGEKKSLKDLEVGEFINSPNGFIEVIDKFNTGIKDVYEIELLCGRKIICTLDHKFLCEDGKTHTLEYIIENNLAIC